MKATRFRAKADADGVVHLDLPLGQPHAEVDVEVAVTHVETPKANAPFNACDSRFFAFILGDRVYSRRRPPFEARRKS